MKKNPQSSPSNLFTTTVTILLCSFLCFRPAHTQLTHCSLGHLSPLALKFNISNCMRLGALSAEIGWNFMNDDNATTTDKQIDILFGAKLPNPRSGYMAWGLNPDMPQMVGTRSLIIRLFENRTTSIDKYDITRDTKRGCRLVPSLINFHYTERARSYNSTTWFLAMAVTLSIPSSSYNVSDLHHVWQVGPLTPELDPSMHGKFLQNFDSCLTINHINATTKSFARLQRQVRKVNSEDPPLNS